MSRSITLLLDNGSLAPAATLRLRELASALAARVGAPVEPVSLLHSSAIPAEALDGRPAQIFEPAVARRAAGGADDFLVVPLFFGPSRALTDYLPERVAQLRVRHPGLRVRLAPPLFDAADERLAQILADHVCAVPAEAGSGPLRVALVDHGSPVPVVTRVRDALAEQLQRLLGEAAIVAPCSMERRPGPDYAFNEPLLEDLLAREGWNCGPVVVAMQFLLPGRHAGPDGDVAEICQRVAAVHPQLVTRLTPLVAEHPRLLDILADRWRAGQGAAAL
ncbi:MAG: cobalamin biosynthesis protein CbiX [Candidatus Didemnitutus sp.]|nr:cobalamin biosynthesis protein CbiX [Candidatus Didemnitutus sp.]